MAKKKKNRDQDPTEDIARDLEAPEALGAGTGMQPGDAASQVGGPPGPDTYARYAVTQPPMDVTGQVTQAWMSLLAMSTQQGASRRDIVVMTLMTAGSVLDITAIHLWPLGQDLPLDEAPGFGHYQAALGGIHQALQALGVDHPFQSLPGTQPDPQT